MPEDGFSSFETCILLPSKHVDNDLHCISSELMIVTYRSMSCHVYIRFQLEFQASQLISVYIEKHEHAGASSLRHTGVEISI